MCASPASTDDTHFYAAHHSPAWHGDTIDRFIEGVGQICEAKIRAYTRSRPGGVSIDQSISVSLILIHDADTQTRHPSARRDAIPGDDGLLRRVVEDISRLIAIEGGLCSVQSGIFDPHGLCVSKGDGERSFPACEDDPVEVHGLPDGAGVGAHIIDVIPIAALKEGKLAAQMLARIPIEATFVIDCPFWLEIRISDVRRIVVIEIGVAGKAECTACRSAYFQGGGKPVSGTDVGHENASETAWKTAVHFFAGAGVEGEATERPHVQGGINCALFSCMHTEVVACDMVSQTLSAV